MDELDEKRRVENIRKDIIEKYEKATARWTKEELTTDMTGAGDERGQLVEGLKQNYWVLDKFVRARTYCDRTGILGIGGKVNFSSEKY